MNTARFLALLVILLGLSGELCADDGAIYLEEIDELHETALDYYVFQRNAYVQNRDLAVRDIEEVEQEEAEDIYYFDDGEEQGCARELLQLHWAGWGCWALLHRSSRLRKRARATWSRTRLPK